MNDWLLIDLHDVTFVFKIVLRLMTIDKHLKYISFYDKRAITVAILATQIGSIHEASLSTPEILLFS